MFAYSHPNIATHSSSNLYFIMWYNRNEVSCLSI